MRVIPQLLEARQVDELRIDTKPVLLEGGTRRLEDIGHTIDLAVSSVTQILRRVSVRCRVA